jgi:hypothetical protein
MTIKWLRRLNVGDQLFETRAETSTSTATEPEEDVRADLCLRA